ncbi:MAG: hypothetical protein AAGA96_19175 [Verrucomicrobiota bacterium]
MNFGTLPTPPQLFRQFERGQISREELHATLALHARDLISQMEQERKNPRNSYLERLRNFAMARKLAKKHGRSRLREVLAGLGAIEGFPPSQILWNANHNDVPLHCFFRSRIEPVFRITRLEVEPMEVIVEVAYGARDKKKTTRELITFSRNARLELDLMERTCLDSKS